MFKKFFSTAAQLKSQICVVGSGPAGFYSAQQVLKLLPSATIDIYDKLPVPFGLVRFGVAPDHPEVKNVINTFTKTGDNDRVKFYGNVCLGKDISLENLKHAYHVVVLCYGAENDKKFHIPGESANNVISARSFVGWYNGLPEDSKLHINLDCEEVVILGQGNVAVDVARILLSNIDDLKTTDITEHSLEVLSTSRIKHVRLIGRRGPLQVAFTIKEFREMIKLPNVQTIFRNDQLDNISQILPSLARPRKRLTELILKSSTDTKSNCNKYFEPIFLRSPREFTVNNDNVTGVDFEINRLEGDHLSPTIVNTGEVENIPCGLALRSIGYRSVCVDPAIPFNQKTSTVIPKSQIYSAGWLCTGPVGVILSTMSNSFEVGQRIVQDLQNGVVDTKQNKQGSSYIMDILKQKGIPVVTWDGWKRIDKEETDRGKLKGKPREKIINIDEMIQISGCS